METLFRFGLVLMFVFLVGFFIREAMPTRWASWEISPLAWLGGGVLAVFLVRMVFTSKR